MLLWSSSHQKCLGFNSLNVLFFVCLFFYFKRDFSIFFIIHQSVLTVMCDYVYETADTSNTTTTFIKLCDCGELHTP